MSRIWGQTHTVSLPTAVGVDVDESGRLIQGHRDDTPRTGASGLESLQPGASGSGTGSSRPAPSRRFEPPQPGPSRRSTSSQSDSSGGAASPQLFDSELEVFGRYTQ